MQCAPRLCHGPKFNCKPSHPLSRRTLRIPSRVPRISKLAASRVFVCSPTMSCCFPLHRKSRLILTSILPRPVLSVLHCRRRNSLLDLSVMSVSLHVSRPPSRVPFPYRHSLVSLPCRCHSRSHLLLTSHRLAFHVLMKNLSYLRISRQSGRKLQYSFRLRVMQS